MCCMFNIVQVVRSPSFIPKSMRHSKLWIFISIKLIRQNLFSTCACTRSFISITPFVLRPETNALPFQCCGTIKHPTNAQCARLINTKFMTLEGPTIQATQRSTYHFGSHCRHLINEKCRCSRCQLTHFAHVCVCVCERVPETEWNWPIA